LEVLRNLGDTVLLRIEEVSKEPVDTAAKLAAEETAGKLAIVRTAGVPTDTVASSVVAGDRNQATIAG
jgi:hypothetical protein